MASTRNKNTLGDYRLEQQNKEHHKDFFIHGMARPINEPNPTHMMNYGSKSRDALSNNAVDIESALFGVGSTNLVDGYVPPRPSLNTFSDIDFSKRHEVVMEKSPKYLRNQRPLMR